MANVCKNCGTQFPLIWRDPETRKLHNLKNRKFCFTCSPFGQHNTVDLTREVKDDPNGLRRCPSCKCEKPLEDFYNRRNKVGMSTYCKPCTTLQTVLRQQDLKRQAVKYMGGNCKVCGYDKYQGALEFHHQDPNEKDYTMSSKLISFEKMKLELDKCVIVCANCHREIHGKMAVI